VCYVVKEYNITRYRPSMFTENPLQNLDHCHPRVTFVSCFVKIYQQEPFEYKNMLWRIEQFEYIANLDVDICIYGDETTTPYLEVLQQKYPNVRLLEMTIPYKETVLHKLCYTPGLSYPERRLDTKDNQEYMGLMNAKMEFVRDAIEKNPFESQTFAWMDFSMAYIFKNKETTLPLLEKLAKKAYNAPFMAIPGCWQPISPNDNGALTTAIHWRFCGTFFMGDARTLMDFYRIYVEHYPRCIEDTQKWLWEVNVWAWLEANTEWSPRWYLADHNDRIISELPESLGII